MEPDFAGFSRQHRWRACPTLIWVVLIFMVLSLFHSAYEVAASQEPTIPLPQREWEPTPPDKARLAVVIDDWGYGWSAADAFFSFPAPLTVAVIPHLTFSDRHARQAREAGYDVMLHLPMEPWGGLSMVEPGAVAVSMTDDEIRDTVERALETMPWAIGVNNHMGSTATEDPRVMAAVLEVIDAGGYFFLDSWTTPHSIVGEVAEAMGVPHLNNQMFIDADFDLDAMVDRLLRIGRTAERMGSAVAIGHVHPTTIEALYRALPKLEAQGVELVLISALISDVPRVQEFGLASRTVPGDAADERPKTLDPAKFRDPDRLRKFRARRMYEGGKTFE